MAKAPFSFNPGEIHKLYHGVSVPDPITFVVSPEYLNRKNLYPRQATLLKIIFLRTDLMTTYDHEVIAEWIENYRLTGKNGIQPDIYERMKILQDRGYPWFREVLEVMGRRAGKGYLGSLAMSYVLWSYMALGDPQSHFGIDRSKQLTALMFAVNKDLAKKNLWKDFVDVIVDSECFGPFIESDQEESLSIYAPNDFIKMHKMEQKNIAKKKKKATFQILPKETSKAGPRGFAAFINGWDEMAHVTASVSKADAGEVYDAASPALDQFKKYAFSVMPSSPWSKEGKFYELYEQSLELDEDGSPTYPNKLMVQLASWDIYLDWERAGYLAMFPEGYKGDLGEYEDKPAPRFAPLRLAIQEYDDEMKKEEQANPDQFKVERRAHFATALDAYLDENKVAQAFRPWEERANGPAILSTQTSGPLSMDYVGHIDPANVNDRMGIALGHVEYPRNDPTMPHVVFDLVHAFDPADYEDHTIDYPEVVDWLFNDLVVPFSPVKLTHDQFNGPYMRQTLYRKINRRQMPKHVWIHEVTATNKLNWIIAETFKAALNLELIHFPDDTDASDWVRQEMLFLQEPTPGRVDHPKSGPVTTKDIWDACAHVVYHLIGERMQEYLDDLKNPGSMGLQGGIDPHERFHPDSINRSDPLYRKLSAAGRRASRGRFGAAPRSPGSLGYGRSRGRGG